MSLTPRIDGIEADTARTGDVVISMLDEATFQAQRSTKWVLMDGRSVTGSDYETLTGNANIPDARGRFPRMKDNGAGVAPSDDALGSLQDDQMQGHRHEAWRSESGYAGGGADFPIADPNSGNTSNTINGTAILSPSTDGVNGTPRTGSETRPKNVTLNFFIKIND